MEHREREAESLRDGEAVLALPGGLGTGTTVAYLLPALARIKEGVEIDRLRRGFSVSLRAIGFF